MATPSKGEEIILSKGDKKYKFVFQLISKDEMLIKAHQEEEEEKDEIIPYTYQKLLTIDDLPKREDIAISSIKVALDQIKSSSRTNQLDFQLENKKNIKLFYSYFGEEQKEQIDLPFAYNTDDGNTIYTLSSMLSKNRKKLHKTFNTIKGLQLNLNKLKHDGHFFTNQLNNIFSDLKNFIKSINDQIASNKKSSDDFFNQIKTEQSSLSTKLNASFQLQTTKHFSDLDAQVQNAFKTQKEQITQQQSTIIHKLTPIALKLIEIGLR